MAQRARRTVSSMLRKIWLSTLLLGTWPHTAASQRVDQALGGVDPGVTLTAVAVSGRTLYVGGNFTRAGPVFGGGVIVDPRTATVREGGPRVAGTVLACVADGRGGWYIGGRFGGVSGGPRTNL